MIPNLPTDSLYKFMCFSGLVLCVLTLLADYNLHREEHELEKNYVKERIDIVNSHTEKLLKTGFTDLDSITRSIISNSHHLLQDNLTTHHEKTLLHLSQKRTNYKILMWIGFTIFIFYLYIWYKFQKIQDDILFTESIKSQRQYSICQSCGTELSYNEITNNIIFCRHCHDGISFTSPNLTYNDMVNKITNLMKERGFTEKEIKWQLSKLPDLYRWKRTFKW